MKLIPHDFRQSGYLFLTALAERKDNLYLQNVLQLVPSHLSYAPHNGQIFRIDSIVQDHNTVPQLSQDCT